MVVPPSEDIIVVTADRTPRVFTASLDRFAVIDARGSGLGWSLVMPASRFRQVDARGHHRDRELAAGSLALAGLDIATDGATAAEPPVVQRGPFTLDGASVVVARAVRYVGMGRFSFTPTAPLRIVLPATAGSARYRSELSITAISGP